jgi:hypothetical protein
LSRKRTFIAFSKSPSCRLIGWQLGEHVKLAEQSEEVGLGLD